MHVTPGGDVFITGTFWSSYYLGVRGAAGVPARYAQSRASRTTLRKSGHRVHGLPVRGAQHLGRHRGNVDDAMSHAAG